MSEAAPVNIILAAKTVDEVLRLLRPHMRQVIASAAPPFLDAFDAAYEDGTVDAVDEIIRGPATVDDLAGEQALGLGGKIATNAVAFVINVAASVAVVRCQTTHPDVWAWLVGSPPAVTSAASPRDPVAKLLAHSGFPPAEQAQISQQIHLDPVLMQVLNSIKLP